MDTVILVDMLIGLSVLYVIMMIYVPDVKEGDRFNRLTFVKLGHRSEKSRQWYWVCKCDCGSVGEFMGSNVRSGRTASCGCFQKERASQENTTHGKSGTFLHSVWKNMKQRCLNKNNPAYENYGGRGITMCKSWEESFEQFAQDVGQPPSEYYSLDRIDNNGGYQKENVRWATDSEQSGNRRKSVRIDYLGKNKTLAQLSREMKFDYYRAYNLIVRKKIPVNLALGIMVGSMEPTPKDRLLETTT